MKFIIRWNAGYGDDYEVVEAENAEQAQNMAYEQWREDAESNADYEAMPYSKEDAVDYGLEDPD